MSWITKTNLGTARGFSSYTKLPNGTILATGGKASNDAALSSCEIYDPIANTWTATGSLHNAQFCHVTVLLNNGKVLMVGGQDHNGNIGTSELYDPNTGLWTLSGTPVTIRTCPAIWPLPSGKILMCSGFPATANAEVYNPATELWTSVSSAPHIQLDAVAVISRDGRALMMGDAQGNFQGIAAYTESGDSWTYYTGTIPNNGEEGNQGIQLPNGNVLIAGGLIGSSASANCYIFNQSNNTISATGSLNTARVGASVFSLANGLVLIVGGDDQISTLFSTTELYNPNTATWTTSFSTNFSHARMAHANLPQLNDGTVIIIGGETSVGTGGINKTEILKNSNIKSSTFLIFD